MFTGIVRHVGVVRGIGDISAGRCLEIDLGPLAQGLAAGDSVAVCGACLTVTETVQTAGRFDVMAETVRVSTIGQWKPGESVNLERAMAADGRFGGHIVQGHVDAVGTVKRVEKGKDQYVLSIGADTTFLENVIDKGSVAVDSVSLTIVDLSPDAFSLVLVPTTLERTTLGGLRAGDPVNIESDLIVRTVLHRLAGLQAGGGVSMGMLREHGFV